jgi:hypothetical protein
MASRLPVIKAISFKDVFFKDGLKMRICIFAEIKSVKMQVEIGRRGERTFFGKQIDYAKPEQVFPGKIVEYRTTPNKKEGKKRESITVLIIGDENGLDIAAKELDYFKVYPYDNEGNAYKPKKQKNTTSIRRNR